MAKPTYGCEKPGNDTVAKTLGCGLRNPIAQNDGGRKMESHVAQSLRDWDSHIVRNVLEISGPLPVQRPAAGTGTSHAMQITKPVPPAGR